MKYYSKNGAFNVKKNLLLSNVELEKTVFLNMTLLFTASDLIMEFVLSRPSTILLKVPILKLIFLF